MCVVTLGCNYRLPHSTYCEIGSGSWVLAEKEFWDISEQRDVAEKYRFKMHSRPNKKNQFGPRGRGRHDSYARSALSSTNLRKARSLTSFNENPNLTIYRANCCNASRYIRWFVPRADREKAAKLITNQNWSGRWVKEELGARGETSLRHLKWKLHYIMSFAA